MADLTYYVPGHVLPNGATVLRSAPERRGGQRPFVVVLAMHAASGAPFVTWVVRPSDRVAFAGHYFTSLVEAIADFDERVKGTEAPRRQGAWGSMTLTAGEIVAHLSRFDPDIPVTIGAPILDEGEVLQDWLNIDGFEEYDEDESVSIIMRAGNDFDSRQW